MVTIKIYVIINILHQRFTYSSIIHRGLRILHTFVFIPLDYIYFNLAYFLAQRFSTWLYIYSLIKLSGTFIAIDSRFHRQFREDRQAYVA